MGRLVHRVFLAGVVLLACAATGHAQLAPLTGATRIAAGAEASCAALASGGAMCWGAESRSGLDSPRGRATHGAAAGQVEGLTAPLVALDVGVHHACAVTDAGAAVCWGGSYGGARVLPFLAEGAIAIAVGMHHSCGIAAGGRTLCWGDNEAGQLGNGTLGGSASAGEVVGLGDGSGTVAVRTGSDFSCALVAGGVRCWGGNSQGQLGDGSTTMRTVPIPVRGLGTGVHRLSVGLQHACAVAGGTVWCWGRNADGQLGDGTSTTRLEPVAVDFGGLSSPGIVDVDAGDGHTCALRDDGAVLCWGRNGYGELGDGTTTRRTLPVFALGLGGPAVAVAAGSWHTCALRADGVVRCFGQNGLGQLGTDYRSSRRVPVRIDLSGTRSLALGMTHGCAVEDAGNVKCWGANQAGEVGVDRLVPVAYPVSVAGLSAAAVAAGAGATHSCVVLDAGTISCWGDNSAGKLGDNGPSRSTPAPVSGPPGATAVDGGDDFTCATAAGGAWCWGANDKGQLGDGTANSRPQPRVVPGLASGVLRIGTGARHACALRSNGNVRCWGSNTLGEIGDGSTTTRRGPTDVVGLAAGVTALSVGRFHACAVLEGAVRCWGANVGAQLGSTLSALVPVDVEGLPAPALDVAAGGSHSCALLTGGLVACWGANEINFNGAVLGPNGTPSGLPPAVVPLPVPAARLYAGDEHSCAVLVDGSTWCWGRSDAARLGAGDTAISVAPRSVLVGDFTSTTSLAVSPSPSAHGEAVAIDVVVNAADRPVDRGNVTIDDAGTPVCSLRTAHNGRARCTLFPSLGVHRYTARYDGSELWRHTPFFPSLAVTTHTVLAVPGQHCAGFDDVDAASALCSSVEWMRNRGITLGCGGLDYCPLASVHRLANAAFMQRLADVVTPTVLVAERESYWLDPESCHVQLLQPVEYPRRVQVDATVSLYGDVAPIDIELGVAMRQGYFGPLLSDDRAPGSPRVTLPPGAWRSLRVRADFDVPGRVSGWVLQLTTRDAGNRTIAVPGRCVVRATIRQRTETFSPFDAP